MSKIRICPKCGSVDVSKSSKDYVNDIMGVNVIYKCDKCNFSSVVFPLVDIKDVEKIRKDLNKKR